MDNTAQNPQVQSQQPTVQNPVVGANTVQTPAPAPQAGTPVTQPQISSRHPEQAPAGSGLPVREAAPVNEMVAAAPVSDDQAAVPDVVSDAAGIVREAAPDIPVQESHPQVEVAPDLQKIGVEPGKDAAREHLPEEQLVQAQEAVKQADTQAAASGISISSSSLQVEEVKKKSGIRDSVKWLATFIQFLQKKIQANSPKPEASATEEVKN